MSTIDEVNKGLQSLRYLPTYTLRAVRAECPVDNNVDVPESQRLRNSFKNVKISEGENAIESDSPYLEYVIRGRGAVFPTPGKRGGLKWRAGLHGSPPVYPQLPHNFPDRSKGKGFFYSGYASPSRANPFVDRAYRQVWSHIQGRGLKEIAHELETGMSSFTYNDFFYNTGVDVSWEE